MLGVVRIGCFGIGDATGFWYATGLPQHLLPRVVVEGDEAKVTVKAIDGSIVKLRARRDITPPNGKIWMTEGGYGNVLAILNERDFRRYTRHAVGETAKGQFILDGFTPEEADIMASLDFEAFKSGQLSSDKAITFENLKRDALDVAVKNNAGMWLTMAGAVVALIPGYGTLIGAGMMIGGQLLSAAEANEIAKRAAKEKKMELIRCRTSFIKNEITEDQYLECQRGILEQVGQDLLQSPEFGRLLIPDPSMTPDYVGFPGILDRVGGFFRNVFRNPVPALAGAAIGLTTAGLVYSFGSEAR